MTAINGTEYEWTATTAHEAVTALDCATQLVYAHLRTALPDSAHKPSTQRGVELPLTIRLDLKNLVELVNTEPGASDNPGDALTSTERADNSRTVPHPSGDPENNYTP